MLSILNINFPSEFKSYVEYEDRTAFFGKDLNEMVTQIENEFIWGRHFKADIILADTGEVIMTLTLNEAAVDAIHRLRG